MTPNHLDEAVDRALREIMGAEPADDLAQRVLREISAPLSSWPRRTLTLGLAACLLLLAVATPRILRVWRSDSPATMVSTRVETPGTPERTPATPPNAASRDARGASGPGPATDVAEETASASARRVTRTSSPAARHEHGELPQVIADARRTQGASALEPGPAEALAVEPLDPIRPIRVAPVIQAPFRIDEIAIEPLEIEPLQVDPLSSATQQ